MQGIGTLVSSSLGTAFLSRRQAGQRSTSSSCETTGWKSYTRRRTCSYGCWALWDRSWCQHRGRTVAQPRCWGTGTGATIGCAAKGESGCGVVGVDALFFACLDEHLLFTCCMFCSTVFHLSSAVLLYSRVPFTHTFFRFDSCASTPSHTLVQDCKADFKGLIAHIWPDWSDEEQGLGEYVRILVICVQSESNDVVVSLLTAEHEACTSYLEASVGDDVARIINVCLHKIIGMTLALRTLIAPWFICLFQNEYVGLFAALVGEGPNPLVRDFDIV